MPDSGVTCHVVPVADAYCTDHPVRSAAVVLGLNSSMKSFRNVAPVLPPAE